METLAERAERELNAILARYSAGEAEVVRTYFAQPRSTEEHVTVLRRQMGREISVIDWLERTVRMGAELEETVERHAFAAYLDQIADEVKHYAALADLAEWVLGRKLAVAEAREYFVHAFYDPEIPAERQYNPRLPEANRMLELVRRMKTEYPADFSHAVLLLTEGGGGAAFLEAGRLSGDEFRERFAAAMRAIADDELDHGPRRVPGFVAKYVSSEADLALATRQLRDVMAQHLRVRNEIYGYPLSAERLAAIDEGHIEPWAMSASTASASA